jgi:putative MFS transporter
MHATAAIVIDVMKPATLAFVAPGMTAEYGLKSATNPHGHIPVALLPLVAITGTVLGSMLWGWLGDRIGRRSSIIYAGLLFVTTSICGAMPSFDWNLLMCFLMGVGAGGMLPITFALLAETIPARHRSWLLVLIGGGVAGLGYVLTSSLAGALIPHYSWRIMWLIGLPTGALFIALNRWIPESPRFLLATGRRAEAEKIMTTFGAALADGDSTGGADDRARDSYRRLFRLPFLGPSVAIVVLAVGAGLITYGFQLWIPTNLQHLGLTTVSSDYIVRDAALYGLPLAVLATALYGFWSSKYTVVLLFTLVAASLTVIAVTGNLLAHNHALLIALLVIPLAGINVVAAIIAVYASEVYPTRIRSRGTGLAAGATKLGGVLIIGLAVLAASTPSIALTAIIGAVPLVVGVAVFASAGRETHHRQLEEIVAAELALAGQAGRSSSGRL